MKVQSCCVLKQSFSQLLFSGYSTAGVNNKMLSCLLMPAELAMEGQGLFYQARPPANRSPIFVPFFTFTLFLSHLNSKKISAGRKKIGGTHRY